RSWRPPQHVVHREPARGALELLEVKEPRRSCKQQFRVRPADVGGPSAEEVLTVDFPDLVLQRGERLSLKVFGDEVGQEEILTGGARVAHAFQMRLRRAVEL